MCPIIIIIIIIIITIIIIRSFHSAVFFRKEIQKGNIVHNNNDDDDDNNVCHFGKKLMEKNLYISVACYDKNLSFFWKSFQKFFFSPSCY